MVSLRQFVCLRFLFISVFLTFAVAAINDTQITSPAWADSAETGGSAEGGAEGSGNGGTTASTGTSSQSEAESTGNSSASGDTVSSTSSSVDQGDSTNSNHINVTAESQASASSSSTQLEAYASAGVTADANSKQDTTSASAGTYNGGEAYAVSTKNGASAFANSADGGYAAAITGPTGATIAYVPGGTSTTYSKGKKSTTIAYSATGSYSIAQTKGKRAWAATGTSENVGALAAGNVKAVVRSAMSAMAKASPKMASAYARASVDAFAENSFGQSRAYGHAYAFAGVRRTGSKIVLSVATSTGPDKCGAQWWKKNVKKHDCIVRHKIINLKANSTTKKKAFAVMGKSKKKTH